MVGKRTVSKSEEKSALLAEDVEGGSPVDEISGAVLNTPSSPIALTKPSRDVETAYILCLTLFNFPYGCICTTMGMFILPAEAVRLFPENESIALGCFLLIVGMSQLICPLVGLISDRCNSKHGRRRPFMAWGTAAAVLSIGWMRYSSLLKWGWCFGFALFVAMNALNVIFSAQCGLVPDIVPEQRQGTASGMIAMQQLLGSFTGFLCVLFSNELDIHHAYPLYQVLLTVVVTIICVFAAEVPLEGPKPLPTLREVMRSYTIDTSKDTDFFLIFVSRTFFYMAVSCQAFMLFYIRDVAGTKKDSTAREQMATIALIGQLTAALVAYPVGGFSDSASLSRKCMIYFACATMSLVYLMFILVPVLVDRSWLLPCVYGVAAFYGVGNGCYLAVDYALALDVLPSKSTTAQDLGVWGIAAFLGSSIGPMVWGTILKVVGMSEKEHEYLFKGYVLMLSGGCLACFFAGFFVRFVKGSR